MIYLAQRGHIHDLPPSKHFLLFDFQAPGLISSDYGRYAVEDPGGALRDVFVWPLIVLRWRLVCSSVFSCWHIYALFLKRFVLCRSFCFIESCAKGASRICAGQWRWIFVLDFQGNKCIKQQMLDVAQLNFSRRPKLTMKLRVISIWIDSWRGLFHNI